MNYLSDKLNSLTGPTLSSVNSRARKRKQPDHDEAETRGSRANVGQSAATSGPAIHDDFKSTNYGHLAATTAASAPFGGDFYVALLQPPPPAPALPEQPQSIGFRPELLNFAHTSNTTPTTSTSVTQPPVPPPRHRLPAAHQPDELAGSSRSLYEGDAWARLWFQRVMVLSLIRLLLFVRKVYEDFQATKTYNLSGQSGHFLISAATLFLPTIVFTIYRVARYLQFALPTARAVKRQASGATHQQVPAAKANDEDDETESRRALMTGRASALSQVQPPLPPQLASNNLNEDDGLVTATQTPTQQLDEQFHDSKSQQEQPEASYASRTVSPAPSTAIVKDSPKRRRLHGDIEQEPQISKHRVALHLADQEGARVAIGASEQLLHGVLFIFWQLKRQVDVLGYLVERSCLWRKPRSQEQVELERLRTGSDGLEWFQDFYAAFLAILAQVYTLGLHWADDKNNKVSAERISAATASAAAAGVEVSRTAANLANAASQHVVSNLQGADLLIMSQLVVSSAVVFSLLIAVRRRDDGPMTLALSMLGWGSIFAARIIIVALAFVHIGWHIMLPLVICHVLGVTSWIYKIALDSHNGKQDESEESRWDHDETVAEEEGGDGEKTEEAQDNVINRSIELGEVKKESNSTREQREDDKPGVTSQWSVMEHVVLLSQIVTLFAIPSLFYWPIMFNLKLHCRPFKYLLLILVQNFLLISAICWYILKQGSPGQWYLLGAVGGFSIVGFLFLSLYVSCKPTLTEYFARADELFNEAERSGIYFEFCSRVFKMPDLSKNAFRRLMNQEEREEEVRA